MVVQPISNVGKSLARFNVHFSALIANLTAASATCIMSWSSPTLPLITKPGKAKIFVTSEQGAWLSSIVALGASFGPFITSRIVDSVGRKMTLMWLMGVMVMTWMVMYFSDVLLILYFARFVAGLSVGCVYATLPMYIGEIAPADLRGTLGSLLQLYDCFGYLLEYIVGALVSYENLILASAVLPLFCILTLIWLPESPYYLHNKGRESDALKALQFFRGYAEINDLQKEVKELEASAMDLQTNESSFLSLFSTVRNLKSVYYAGMLILFQQTSGINIITFYSKTIFQESGSSISEDLSSIIIAIVMAVTSIVTVVAAKIFRIRYLLAFSGLGQGFSMVTLGTYFYFASRSNVSTFDWLPITSLIGYICTYTLGFGPLVWIISFELYPVHLKAFGCALTASWMWILSFILTRFFASFTDVYGKATAFWLFGCCSFLSIFFVLYQLPDTQGKTFQEIEDTIRGKKSDIKTLPVHINEMQEVKHF